MENTKMMVPTNGDVVAAFNSVGGLVVQPMAVRFALEKQGFGILEAAEAVSRALADDVLGKTSAGGLFHRAAE